MADVETPRAVRGDGADIDPRSGVIPIAKELCPGRLAIIGTGFYLTRYGLFGTAAHVLECLLDSNGEYTVPAYVIHSADEDTVHLRRILQITRQEQSDIAVGHAQNFSDRFPDDPLLNLRPRLMPITPPEGARLITYAYPENETLDFTAADATPIVESDYYEGVLLAVRSATENPLLPQVHFETSIEIRSGASGGPVFYEGNIVGVNCRGWDFRGSEFEGDELSSVIPISEALTLDVPVMELGERSWEYQQIPPARLGHPLTIAELGSFGHIEIVGLS
jgi:hypothetical protein